ncbi:MAG: AAA family ATPase [Bacteroidales bacterium]|nr:AAA family ATPase [Bacteroidales bacterium]
MTTREEIVARALEHLTFTPNEEQELALNMLADFVVNKGWRDVFVLNGYAGTGKTSVMGALTGALADCGIKTVILAPTGRAAKVASGFARHPAFTIHKRIYRGNSSDPANTKFFLAPNNDRDTIFIVDEASLIGDSPVASQSLLVQLAQHVYSAPGCAMILVGDVAQLPPVGQDRSPAMNQERLISVGLNPLGYSLDIPVRQASGSGILYNATMARSFLSGKYDPSEFALYTQGFPDVEAISSRDLEDYISSSWETAGRDETLIITRSNRRANDFNKAIRNLMMDTEVPLQRGDRLVIARNDYYWSKENGLKGFLANGEAAEVVWVGRMEKAYGRYFTDVELQLAGGQTINAKLMLRSLVAEGPQIPREELERLYQRVLAEKEGAAISEKIKFAMEDPYYNALQAKYAYCVTCHKAQGGQWKHIYIDMAGINTTAIETSFYRWLYTALTRATEKVFLINPPFEVK